MYPVRTQTTDPPRLDFFKNNWACQMSVFSYFLGLFNIPCKPIIELDKEIIEQFAPRFTPGGYVSYVVYASDDSSSRFSALLMR